MNHAWSVVALLLLAPIAIAEGDTTEIAQDVAGDSPVQGRTDLLALRAVWDGSMITWELDVGESQGNGNVAGWDSAEYAIHFKVGQREYIAFAERSAYVMGAAEGPDWDSGLMERRGGSWEVTQEGAEPTEDGTTITWVTDDSWLFDERGIPLLPGQGLTDIHVEATGVMSGFSALLYEEEQPLDRMPDEGTAGPLIKPADPSADSTYLMFSEVPVRTSNGGPTLLVYELELFNGALEPTTFDMSVTDHPSAWTVAVSPASPTIEPLSSKDVLIIVESKGGHAHGQDDVFTVTASAEDGEASIDLTLHYPEIPELSGHHEQVWFHAARYEPYGIRIEGQPVDLTPDEGFAPSGSFWMNTIQDDPSGSEKPYAAVLDQDTALYTWTLPLGPAPRLGFDFDLEDTGSMEFRLEPYHDLDIEGIALEVALEAYEDGAWTSVADIPDVPSFTLTPEGRDFALDIAPTRDVVSYHSDLQLRLRIAYDYSPTAESSGLGSNVPVLMPGGSAIMPMDEYQDPLPPELAVLLADQGVTIDDDGALVAPTATVDEHEAPGIGLMGTLLGLGAAVRSMRRH